MNSQTIEKEAEHSQFESMCVHVQRRLLDCGAARQLCSDILSVKKPARRAPST